MSVTIYTETLVEANYRIAEGFVGKPKGMAYVSTESGCGDSSCELRLGLGGDRLRIKPVDLDEDGEIVIPLADLEWALSKLRTVVPRG